MVPPGTKSREIWYPRGYHITAQTVRHGNIVPPEIWYPAYLVAHAQTRTRAAYFGAHARMRTHVA